VELCSAQASHPALGRIGFLLVVVVTSTLERLYNTTQLHLTYPTLPYHHHHILPLPNASLLAMGALLSLPLLALPGAGTIITAAASCCGAATCSAVCSACGKCQNR